MYAGPTLIFDKSFLQGLNPDESLWLESFFTSNITPLFFIETLADLEKEVRKGRTPEEVVGSIAYKTPDMGCVNVHHRELIIGELFGKAKIEMLGRPIIAGGRRVELGGKTGVIFQESPEIEASHRWERKEFLEIERGMARNWRKELAFMEVEDLSHFEKLLSVTGKPKSFEELKRNVDLLMQEMNSEAFLDYGMALMGIIDKAREKIINRWKQTGSKPLKEFAPYFMYVLSIDLFFYMGTAAKIFEAFPHPQTHKIDIAYLYYLPFCKVFTSNDRIHIALASIFMRPDQTFIPGNELKQDFTLLDQHYDKLPNEVKERGSSVFAPCPPDDILFLTTRLWDKYMATTWRSLKDNVRKFDGTDKVNPEIEREVIDHIKKFVKEGKVVNPSLETPSDNADSMLLRHKLSIGRGKWKKFPPEVLKGKPILD